MGNWLSRIKGTRVSRGGTQALTYGGRARVRKHAGTPLPPYGKDTAFDGSTTNRPFAIEPALTDCFTSALFIEPALIDCFTSALPRIKVIQ